MITLALLLFAGVNYLGWCHYRRTLESYDLEGLRRIGGPQVPYRFWSEVRYMLGLWKP